MSKLHFTSSVDYCFSMQKIHNHFKLSLRLSTLFTLSAFVLNCSSRATHENNSESLLQTPQTRLTKSDAHTEISVMEFNVENLFDGVHDTGTEDYPFLPLSEKSKPEIQKFCGEIKSSFYKQECFEKNWNEDIIKFKLSQVAKTIQYTENGRGADIILMEEVENLKILNRLADTELKDMGYKTRILIEGPDTRGIDPALLSKFPLSRKPVLHIIPYQDSNPERLKIAFKSRGILEVPLELPNGKELTILVGHFPSQSNPTEWRAQAIQFLKEKMIEYENQGRAVIAGGDFNIIDSEEKIAGYFAKELSQAGAISHLVGCKECKGTHNHKGHWSFLDILVFGNNIERAGLDLIPDSIEVVMAPHHIKKNGAPLSFQDEKKGGVSDHFPLYSRLRIKFYSL
jgi:endonuclease/exonuclease/phosphatase family metal-dependent hydrolase